MSQKNEFENIWKRTMKPHRVAIDACSICQLQCTGCYMRKSSHLADIGEGWLSASNFEKFLNNAPYVSSVELSNNGEPFLNPELGEIFLIASKHNVHITIGGGANFNRVDSRVLELIVKTGVRILTIALDGASQKTYAMYRRGGDFDNVIENIRLLNFYKEKFNSEWPKLNWQFVLMQHNQYEVLKAKELASQLQMKISFKLSWEPGFHAENPKQLTELTGLDCFSREAYMEKKHIPYRMESCLQLFTRPAINWDGRLLGCTNNWRQAYDVNVFKVGLEEALQNCLYQSAKYRLMGNAEDEQNDFPCCYCPYHYFEIRKKTGKFLTSEDIVKDLNHWEGIERLNW